MQTYFWFMVAAVAEIAGCYTFWMWLRMDRDWTWTLAGVASLIVFAIALTRVDTAFAGRAYAAYGGIYILAALLWLMLIEQRTPDRWDLIGVALCVAGATVIVFGPRTAT